MKPHIVPHTRDPIDLSDYDPADRCGFKDKTACEDSLDGDVKRLAELQDMFAAQTHYAVLIVLQGMDAAGKDGIIKHVMSGANPQGVTVHGFRAPSPEEARHDYLWRANRALPERGQFAIFNRSYYEDVLVVRVQPELLAGEGGDTAGPELWEHRYEDINAFERHLTRCGTIVLKFFLHLSKKEQRKRLLERLETPDKMWKASDADLAGHARWDAYVEAYEAMLGRTSTTWAPWCVVPSDRKHVARAVVGGVIVDRLERLGLRYPEPSPERRKSYAELAKQLENEK